MSELPQAATFSAALGKLCVRDRAAAIVFAYDNGVVTLGITLN